jgi:membrane peptidoglycan carboxypeptidase
MAIAYAGIANNGATCSAVVIDKIVGSDGAEIPVPKTACTQSVDPAVAAGMAYAMTRVMNGTAAQSYGATSPKVPMIGKTGTTDNSKDTWMSGGSTKVITVVGVVSVTGEIAQRSIRFDSGPVATARHRMWPDVMSVANAKYGGDAFPQAADNIVQAVQVSVPDLRGKTMAEAKSTLESAGFTFADGGVTDSEMPVGTVARTDAAGGAQVSRGSSVTVFSSNGELTLVPNVVGQSKDAATSALNGFRVSSSTQTVTDEAQDGTVISMTPGGGTAAKPGTTVDLVIGKFTDSGSKPDSTKPASGSGNGG